MRCRLATEGRRGHSRLAGNVRAACWLLALILPGVVNPALHAQPEPPPAPGERNFLHVGREFLIEQVGPSDATLEQLVFRNERRSGSARRRLDAQLTGQIADIDHACKLSEAQKQKLRLAGLGDIKRFFDRFDQLKAKAQSRQLDEQDFRTVTQDCSVLATGYQAGIFHEDSLLYKALPHTLTNDQLTRYNALSSERRAFRHRANLESALNIVHQYTPLREKQHREFRALLTNDIKPARRSTTYDHCLIWIELGRLPEAKLKPLFDEVQWQMVSQLIAQYQRQAPHLQEAGVLPPVDEETDERLNGEKK